MEEVKKNLGKVMITPEGIWNIKKPYDILCLVYEIDSKCGYISKKAVPSGVDISNNEYWMPYNSSGYSDSNMIVLNNVNENNQLISYTLEEAINNISINGRKRGCIITFYNSNADRLDINDGRWELWQYNGTDISGWTNTSNWQNIYYNYNKFVGWYASSQMLVHSNPYPEVGCYAYVGLDLNKSFIYRCDEKHIWTNTNVLIWDHIKIIVDGNVTISQNGTWIANGIDTGIPVSIKGDNGPIPVFRNNNNVIEYSIDDENWIPVSDNLTTHFRWVASDVNDQSNSIGKIQMSKDNINWVDLSNDMINSLKIYKYINANEELPTTDIAEGTIYAKGPTYKDTDIDHVNPIYRLYVYAWKDSILQWIDNGEYNSIQAGIVQELGDSKTEVISQKCITDKFNEVNSKLNYILDGADNIKSILYSGDNVGASTVKSKIESNISVPFNYKLIAETDLIYVTTDNEEHTFIDLAYTPAGSLSPIHSFAELRGNVGDTISRGTVIHEGIFNPTIDSDIYIRSRMNGTVRLEYFIGDRTSFGYNEIKEKVISNTTKVENHNQSITNINSQIESINNRLTAIEPSEQTVISETITGVGNYTNTARWKIASNLNINTELKIKIVAISDVVYSSADNAEHTFVDVVYYPTGTTSPTNLIWENRGNVGSQYSAGTVILDINYTTPANLDIWLRGRFIGNVKVDISYGGEIYELTSIVENHETRIQNIESSLNITSKIIDQYKHQVARALQLGYIESRSASSIPIKPLVFMHVSDTHAITNNNRAFEILNYVASKGNVKFLMHTGDILEDPKNADQNRWSTIVQNAQYPVMVATGNHDVGNWATAQGQYTTSEEFYNKFIYPIINKWELKTDGNGVPHPSNKNYYFKDFTEEKIRFIVVDEYEFPNKFTSDGTTLVAGRGARWISQAQTDWFVNSLLTVPNGYGVIVVKHSPDGKRGEDDNAFNSPFLKGKEHQQTYQYYNSFTYTTFFADIIQAFMNKTTITKTINQSAGGYSENVLVNTNFSGIVDQEFICYVTGHTHADGINFLKDYPQQLDLNINCSNTFYQHYSNLNLIVDSMYEDALNVYSVDRNNGVIHIVRIGGEYSADGDRRDILTIKYK